MESVHLPTAGILARVSSVAETALGPARDTDQDTSKEPWYGSEWLWLALAALSTLPFILSPLPPLGDLFSHMGRYHVAQTYDQSAWLQRYYRFEWALLPNLGQDLLMVPFGRVFGIERGAMILSAMIPALTIPAIRSLSIAIHGRVQPLALLALPFTYSFTYLFGFMNFNTGVVVALWSMVAWHRTQNLSAPMRAALIAVLATACWICHLATWALLVIAIGSFEVVRVLRARASIAAAAKQAMPVIVAVLLPAVLSWYTHVASSRPPVVIGDSWLHMKFAYLRWALRDESALVDGASLLVIVALPAALLLRRHLRVEASMALLGIALFALYLIIPTAINDAFYADVRFLPIALTVMLLACRDTLSADARKAVAIGAIALFAGRISLTTHGWIDRGNSLQQELGAIEKMPPGARVASAGPSRTCETWQNDGLATLASYALLRRDAFVTTEWNIPGQHILQPVYLGSTPTPPTIVAYHRCGGIPINDWLATFPRAKFDFVWLFKVQPSREAMNWLTPVYRGPQGVLYAVRHDAEVAVAKVPTRS